MLIVSATSNMEA